MSMPLALYMDVHVPMAITQALRRKRLDILTSQDDGTARLHDAMLLQRATDLQRVLFSQDHDFLKITSEWQRKGRTFSGVVYASQQAVSLGGSPTISSSSSLLRARGASGPGRLSVFAIGTSVPTIRDLSPSA